mmetsp:Transcript_28027/g.84499  ORF Transcript_28027/g.84499 Transcript_28027/m.84499 type:complete len:246 (+) Transcript_28027:772-1509(+)
MTGVERALEAGVLQLLQQHLLRVFERQEVHAHGAGLPPLHGRNDHAVGTHGVGAVAHRDAEHRNGAEVRWGGAFAVRAEIAVGDSCCHAGDVGDGNRPVPRVRGADTLPRLVLDLAVLGHGILIALLLHFLHLVGLPLCLQGLPLRQGHRSEFLLLLGALAEQRQRRFGHLPLGQQVEHCRVRVCRIFNELDELCVDVDESVLHLEGYVLGLCEGVAVVDHRHDEASAMGNEREGKARKRQSTQD